MAEAVIVEAERLALMAGRYLSRDPGGLVTKDELARLLVRAWPVVEAALYQESARRSGDASSWVNATKEVEGAARRFKKDEPASPPSARQDEKRSEP